MTFIRPWPAFLSPTGMCFGDSGGPNLSNGGRTVYGVNSYAIDSNCTGMTYSQRVDLPSVLTWIHSFL